MQNLVKLKIFAYKDPACKGPTSDSIVAFINPSSYQRKLTVDYSPDQTLGAPAPTLGFKSMGQSDLSLSFFCGWYGGGETPGGLC